jgi:nicotinamide-nucleotide amidase
MSLPTSLTDKANDLLQLCLQHAATLATVESCTGGLVAAAITAIPGSSRVLERGFVTYSNQAKTDLVGVPADLILAHGAVSEQVARAMAEGALVCCPALASLSITGIAGPDGGSATKPVGLVHIAAAMKGANTLHQHCLFDGDRDFVREQAAIAAMELVMQLLCHFR